MTRRTTAAGTAGALLAALLLPTTVASAAGTTHARAVSESGDLNVVSYSNPVEPGYSSPGDAFHILQRPAGPFAVLDDSAAGFAADTQGIVGVADTGPYFGIVDTVNGDGLTAPTATWTFDVSGSEGALFVDLEMGAMGDFESSDVVTISATVDGGDPAIAAVAIDEDSERSYTLDDGDVFVEQDPANIGSADLGGVVALDDDFQTVTLALPAGDEVVLEVNASTNGGSEAFAIREISVGSEAGGTIVAEAAAPEPVCTTPAEDLTLISEVQGDGFATPLPSFETSTGSTTFDEYTVRGVVTFADADLPGIFVQEEPADVDDDPLTSEGIFVFLTGAAADFEVGQTVEMTDEVNERFGLTQMAFPSIEVCDVEPVEIAPTELTLPADDVVRESLEGMLVVTTQQLDVTGLFAPYAFGELGVTSLDAPLIQPTSVYDDDSAAAQELFDLQAASFLKIDDRGEFGGDRDPWSPDDQNPIGLRPGDTIDAGVIGPLTYTFGEYKIEPRQGVGQDPDGDGFPLVTAQFENPRPVAPSLADGNDVGAFNVLNYFNSFGDSAALRGATNAADLGVQEAKIVDAINTLDAAVLGLIEIENDYGDFYDGDPTTVPALVELVDALNAAAGFDKWAYVLPAEEQLVDKTVDITEDDLAAGAATRGLGTDAIANAIVYQPARATEIGAAATFDIDALLTGDADNNRWPLAQTFDVDGETVTAVVNHFKSKGSSCDDTAGPGFDLGDDVETALTGNCNLTRVYAAERLIEWVETKPTGATTPDALVIGDLNAYEEEDPIEVFLDAGYADVIGQYGDDAFTYKFDGRYGRLDHVLASPSAKRLVTDAAVWQANSLEFYGNLYDNSPVDLTGYASSDHDPVVASLDGPGRSKGPNR